MFYPFLRTLLYGNALTAGLTYPVSVLMLMLLKSLFDTVPDKFWGIDGEMLLCDLKLLRLAVTKGKF